jgi:hypothetical protein
MKLVWLFWYIAGVLALVSLAMSLISHAPEAEGRAAVLAEGSAGSALTAASVAYLLSDLPRNHWIHRSRPVWAVFVAGAVTVVTLVLVLVG